jgi:hypothetical protein
VSLCLTKVAIGMIKVLLARESYNFSLPIDNTTASYLSFFHLEYRMTRLRKCDAHLQNLRTTEVLFLAERDSIPQLHPYKILE